MSLNFSDLVLQILNGVDMRRYNFILLTQLLFKNGNSYFEVLKLDVMKKSKKEEVIPLIDCPVESKENLTECSVSSVDRQCPGTDSSALTRTYRSFRPAIHSIHSFYNLT